MVEPTLAASTRRSGEDFLVAGCGLVTCVVTALILWWIEAQFGFALYTWTFWFVVPAGAILAGFAGASGYCAGSWLFGHRPTRLLLLNIVIASVVTFFLIYYLSYVTLRVEGKQVSDYISFWQYLDLALRSTSMEFRYHAAKLGSTGELGYFGYAIAVLQIIGFAVGGLVVYGVLVSKPYCEKCSRYLSGKGTQVRYTHDSDGLQVNVAQVLQDLANGAVAPAIEFQRGFGNPKPQKDDHLRSTFEVRYCKKCNQHWVKFAIEKWSGKDWKEIPQYTTAGFTGEVVSF
jgi:hypothetical protein